MAVGLFLVGQVPTVVLSDNHIIAVPVGSLSITGQAPVIVIGQVVSPNIDVLILTGQAPSSEIVHIRGPPVGSLALTGNAPTLASVIPADAGSLSLSGLAPSAEITHIRNLGAGSLTLGGLAPTISVSTSVKTVKPDAGSLSLSGQIPQAFNTSDDKTVTPGAGSLSLSGLQPEAALESPKKGGRRKKRRRYIVEVDGQFFEVASVAEAQSVLAQLRELAVEVARPSVEKGIQIPRVTVKTVLGNEIKSVPLKKAVTDTNKVIRNIYARAKEQLRRDQEISRLFHKKLHEEEEDDIIALLLL